MAVENQARLKEVGDAIAAKVPGAEFKLPPGPDNGVKKLQGAREKLDRKGYKTPARLTDLARASFVVDSPEAAHSVVRELSRAFPGRVFDEGWKTEPNSLYRDRKSLIQFDNRAVGEVQVISRGMYRVKTSGGHDLYTLARSPSTPRGQAALFTEVMRAKYSDADSGARFN